MLVRKRPVAVEAVRWTGDNLHELIALVGDNFRQLGPEENLDDPTWTAGVWDVLHNSWIGLRTGDWVIRGIKGEFHPCAAEVFTATYGPPSEIETELAAIAADAVADWLPRYTVPQNGPQMRLITRSVDETGLVLTAETCDPFPCDTRYFRLCVSVQEIEKP